MGVFFNFPTMKPIHLFFLFLFLSSVLCRPKPPVSQDDLTEKQLTFLKTIHRKVPVAEQKDCVFLHGSGELEEGPVTSTFTEYWGNVHEYTPQCKTRTFNHDDTTHQAFDEERLMRRYCDVATGKVGGNLIKNNTIVFTHSMGTPILAAALKNGLCRLDPSASWYDASGPLFGSKAADVIESICANPSAWDEPLRWIGQKLNYCEDSSKPSNVTKSYQSLSPSYPGYTDLMLFAATQVKGSICGTSAYGLLSPYSLALAALADVVWYGEKNDGLVAVSSCLIPQANYDNRYQSDFYIAPLNHADTTCRNGNGFYDTEERMPCGWYSLRY